MADAPLFGTPIPSGSSLSALDLKRSLAQAMLAGAGDTSPVGSKWGALSRALSPLAGILAMKSVNKQYAALSDAAGPIFSQLAHSDDPVSIAAASNNPLIRALLPQLAEKQIGAGFDLRGDTAKATMAKKLSLEYDPQIAGATGKANLENQLAVEPKITAANAAANLPYQKQLLKLQQALGYANLGEEIRSHKATEAATAGKISAAAAAAGGGNYGNPASMYGSPQ